MEVLFALTLCILEDISHISGEIMPNFFLTISLSSCLLRFDDEGGEKNKFIGNWHKLFLS